MKNKFEFVLIITSLFFITSCGSITPSIKFKELSSDTFTLNRIFYATILDEKDRDVSDIFETLPIPLAVGLIKAKYNINVDVSLFTNKEVDISQVKSYNLGMRNHFIEFQTDNTQIISMSFTRLGQNELSLEVRLRIVEGGKTISMSDYAVTIPN